MPQLDFKSYVALRLMKTERGTVTRNPATAVNELRFDNIGHLLIHSPDKARRRCRICHSQTVHICQKCKVHLHTICFVKYHTAS